ncbi:putative Ig domain-containing protein [Egicoccus sp. AB-alg2]|uniref:putative Ig domain-containing protein n=1 Tax=Egicoccus sp. AB-alg2 TaxID=3242693 RepID=UPI00359F06F8
MPVTVAVTAALLAAMVAPSSVALAQEGPQKARHVRTTYTSEFGIPRPHGIAVAPEEGVLVAGPAEEQTVVIRLSPGEDLLGTTSLPGVDPATMATDPDDGNLVAVADGELVQVHAAQLRRARPTVTSDRLAELGLRRAAGATVDEGGDLLLLDAGDASLVRVAADDPSAAPERTPLPVLEGDALAGLAYNPQDGRLYVLRPDDDRLDALDESGQVQASYDLSDVTLVSPQEMVFAPSSDASDDPETYNLFVADAGSQTVLGGVTEITLTEVSAANVPVETASLVRMIETSKWTPASPDPSGVTYLPGSDRLMVADSEVNEVTGAGYHGVNLWTTTRTGGVTDTGTTLGFTNEPTGLGYDAATNTLFVSSDASQTRGVFSVRPGNDGRFGTPDDVVRFFNAAAIGVVDTEDPEFDPVTGHLFFLDGINTNVYRVNPVNGVFFDGDDIVTHFDVGRHGALDVEGLGSDPSRNTLLVGDRRQRRIYEVTKTGDLVRIIDASRIADLTFLSGLTMAPATNAAGRMNYWIVDRAVDNGADPNENDGKLFEITLGATGNTGPVLSSVTIDQSAPRTDDTLTVSVQASDADGDPLTYEYQWRKNGVALPGETGDRLDLSKSGNGDRGDAISVRVTVSDGQAEDQRTSSQVTIVNSPPVFGQDLPNRSDTEGASVSIVAGASDADGDTLTYSAAGLPAGVSIDTSTGRLSGTIAAGAAASSPYDVTVSVTDGGTSGPPSPGTGVRLVQSKAGDQNNSTSYSLAFDQQPRQGNLLVAFGAHSASRTSTVPSGWSRAVDAGRSVIFYKVAGANEPATVTYSVSGTETFMGLSILEYEGLHGVQSEVLDRVVSQSGSGTSVSTGTTATTRHADQLLVAGVGLNGTRTFANQWTEGFAARSTARRHSVADRVVSSTGQFQTSESWDTSANFAVGSLVTFRIADTAPPSDPAAVTDTFRWTVTTGGGGGPVPGPPVVDAVTVTPTSPRTDGTLTAEVTASGGSGSLTYSYQWLRNGTALSGATSRTLDLGVAGNGDKGDTLAVRVTASDGTSTSPAVTSATVTVVNSPPVFGQDLPDRSDAEGATVSIASGATDRDGDDLTYSATGLPGGISINSATGAISGTLAAGSAGTHAVTVTVRDTSNATATDTFTWTVTAPAQPPPAPTALTATSTSIGVDLGWNTGGSGVTGYHVYRASSASGPYTRLTTNPQTSTTYRDETAPIGSTSHYRVTALNADGLESAPATASSRRAIGFRGASTAAGRNLTSAAVQRPSGVAAGDVLVAAVTVYGNANITAPSGWNLVRNDANGTNMRQAVFSRVAASNEAASYTWTLSTRTSATVVVVAYRGVDAAQPVDVAGGQANAASRSIATPSVTTTGGDRLLIAFFGFRNSTTIDQPEGMIEQAEVLQSSGNDKLALSIADEVRPSAGATGTRTASVPSGPTAVSVGQVVALRPATP